MHQLSHREIQLYLLEILKSVDAFCVNEGIRYSMAYGTLLGAVRHKGFIPWDDDIDLLMPRPDYERFVSSFGKEPGSRYHCLCHKTGVKGDRFIHFFSKVEDVKTKSIQGKGAEYDFGLNIDVFPMDGISGESSEIEKILKKTRYYRRLLFWNYVRLDYKGTSLPRRIAKIFAVAYARSVGARKCKEKILKLAAETPYESAEFVLDVVADEHRLMHVHGKAIPKAEYEKSTKVCFEGHSFDAMQDYDAYLKFYYGDYMTLPPADKQVGHEMSVYGKD